MLNRRGFLHSIISILSGMGWSFSLPGETRGKTNPLLREAMFYESLNGQDVQCRLCPRECVIGDGERGFCRNRENRKGKLYTVVYGKPCAVNVGPIEKAPLYHFVPGHMHNSTFCPSFNRKVIHRRHFDIVELHMKNGKCEFCDFPIEGIWAEN